MPGKWRKAPGKERMNSNESLSENSEQSNIPTQNFSGRQEFYNTSFPSSSQRQQTSPMGNRNGASGFVGGSVNHSGYGDHQTQAYGNSQIQGIENIAPGYENYQNQGYKNDGYQGQDKYINQGHDQRNDNYQKQDDLDNFQNQEHTYHQNQHSEITVLSTEIVPIYDANIILNEDFPENSNGSNQLFDRLGVPIPGIKAVEFLQLLGNQVADLIQLIYESFLVDKGKLVMINGSDFEADVIKNEKLLLTRDINEVYVTARLVSSMCPNTSVLSFRQNFTVLRNILDDLFSSYTQRNEEQVPIEDFGIVLSLALLVSALSHFIDAEEQTRAEPALALLISLTQLEHVVDAFNEIFPPAHQSRLFTLTLYRDLQRVEAKLESEEFDQIAKLKAIMELAFKRYGDFFLRYYADEVMQALGVSDLIECPLALWNKAVHGSNTIQLDLGVSFLVSLIKYQWGIIKDFNGIAPDPTNNVILYEPDLENLFEFLYDQAQQLFLFVGALSAVLNDEQAQFGGILNATETLIAVYMEIMNHLDRLCTALINSYHVVSQEDSKTVPHIEQMKSKQSCKAYILLLTLSVCSIQLLLTGPLQITTAPSISAVLEYYISKSDFTTPIKNCVIMDKFALEFFQQSPNLIRNYSIIRGLSTPILLHLEGKDKTVIALNTGLSWNMLSLFILMSSLLLIQFFWLLQAAWLFACDKFWV